MEFVVRVPASNVSLPRFWLSGGVLRVSYTDYPNAFSPVVSQFLELPINNYAVSLSPEDQSTVEVRVHGVQIASCDEFHSDLAFDLGSFVPFRSSSWRVALATNSSLPRFMFPQFNDSDWSSYTGGEWIYTDRKVWLLRTSFFAQATPAGLGLYYQLQEGMRVYLNGHEVFSVNAPETMTVRSRSRVSSTMRAERAVLSSLWLLPNALNTLAIAVTSSSPSSRLQLSLFPVSSPLSAIRPETTASSSFVALFVSSNVVLLFSRRASVCSRIVLLHELRPPNRSSSSVSPGDQLPRHRPLEEHERHARRHSGHGRGRRRSLASREFRPPPQSLRFMHHSVHARLHHELPQRPLPHRYSECVWSGVLT